MKIKLNILGEEKEFTIEEALELKRQLSVLAEPQQIYIPFVQQPPYLQPPYVVTCSYKTDTYWFLCNDGKLVETNGCVK